MQASPVPAPDPETWPPTVPGGCSIPSVGRLKLIRATPALPETSVGRCPPNLHFDCVPSGGTRVDIKPVISS
jgi:hypothetical protein